MQAIRALKLAGSVQVSKQPVERRHGLLARALRGNKPVNDQLPDPKDATP